jgi:hypothetical protein
MFSKPLNSVPQRAHPKKYVAIVKSATIIIGLSLFWYAAMLDLLGPFALFHPWAWSAYLSLESFWMQTLGLPYPMTAPSYGFDLIAVSSLGASALLWWRSGHSLLRFLCLNVIAFESLLFVSLPSEMFDHVIDLTPWKLGSFYILNNFLMMALAQVALAWSVTRQRP